MYHSIALWVHTKDYYYYIINWYCPAIWICKTYSISSLSNSTADLFSIKIHMGVLKLSLTLTLLNSLQFQIRLQIWQSPVEYGLFWCTNSTTRYFAGFSDMIKVMLLGDRRTLKSTKQLLTILPHKCLWLPQDDSHLPHLGPSYSMAYMPLDKATQVGWSLFKKKES